MTQPLGNEQISTIRWMQQELHADSLTDFVKHNWWCLAVGPAVGSACLLMQAQKKVAVVAGGISTAGAFAIQLLRTKKQEEPQQAPAPVSPPKESLLKQELKKFMFTSEEKWLPKEQRDANLTHLRDERISNLLARSPGDVGAQKALVLIDRINEILAVDDLSDDQMENFAAALKGFLEEEEILRLGRASPRLEVDPTKKTAQQLADDQLVLWAENNGWITPEMRKPENGGNCLFESVEIASGKKLADLRTQVVAKMQTELATNFTLRGAIEGLLRDLSTLPSTKRYGITPALCVQLEEGEEWIEREGCQAYLESLKSAKSWGSGLELPYIEQVLNKRINVLQVGVGFDAATGQPNFDPNDEEVLYLIYQKGYSHYLPAIKPKEVTGDE